LRTIISWSLGGKDFSGFLGGVQNFGGFWVKIATISTYYQQKHITKLKKMAFFDRIRRLLPFQPVFALHLRSIVDLKINPRSNGLISQGDLGLHSKVPTSKVA